MRNNTYDQPDFFKKYSEMLRSKEGLKGAGEWSAVEKMLPDFQGKRVLDIGCGYGWHCLYAASKGAVRILGIDLSEKMLQEAERRKESDVIEYCRIGIEDYEYPADSFDIVISSLALHYVDDLYPVFERIYRTLASGGQFIFTIEHPIFTAYGSQDWHYDAEGEKHHWPVDNYFCEGIREAIFLGEKVTKYHHTLTSILSGLLQSGFEINGLEEPQPTAQMLHEIPQMKEELRRPMMLVVSAKKPVERSAF